MPRSNLHPLTFSAASTSTPFSAAPDNHYIVNNTGAVALVITLPDPTKCPGAIVEVSRSDSGSAPATNLFYSATTLVSVTQNYYTGRVYSDGANWKI